MSSLDMRGRLDSASTYVVNTRRGARPSAWNLHRVLLIVGAVSLIGPSLAAWTSIVQIPAAGIIATLGCISAVALSVTAAIARRERTLIRLDYALLVSAVAILGAWAAASLYAQPGYGTDEAAFVQYASQLILHGRNPYTTNLSPALTQFRVPPSFITDRLNGTVASTLDYPSLSFLIVVPFTVLTHEVQSVILENVVALAVELVLMFFFIPRQLRALAVVAAVGLMFLFDNAVGGVILTMAMPFLLVVAYRWSDIGRAGKLGRGGIVRAICLGLAASISQFPWFVIPFLLIALFRLRSLDLGPRRGMLVAVRFAAATAAVFLCVNAPFLVWSPRSWLSGILGPLVQKAVPLGQGLIDATIFLHIGGGDLDYYSAAAVSMLLMLVAVHAFFFTSLARATFLFPSVAFLFSTRSLSEYFIMMVATWLVSICAAGSSLSSLHQPATTLDRPLRLSALPARWLRGAVVASFGALALVSLALALSTPGPLAMRMTLMRSNGEFQSIWRLGVTVTNDSDMTLAPHFAVDSAGYMTSFWNVVAGPRELGGHESGTYLLDAPNVASMPGVTRPFYLQAVTASPDTMSSSSLVTPQRFTTQIMPSYVNRTLPLGKSVTLHVILRSPYGQEEQKGGVPIALGQIVYGQNALIDGEAQINTSPPGRSPVIARTDGAGVATFRVRDTEVQGGNPLYFQAYVSPDAGYPYGYSEVVSVEWSPRRHSSVAASPTSSTNLRRPT